LEWELIFQNEVKQILYWLNGVKKKQANRLNDLQSSKSFTYLCNRGFCKCYGCF